jgi:hypothetical protein
VDAKLSWDDPSAAATSLLRLRELPVAVTHAGHERSFDGDELRRAVDRALEGLDA